MDPINPDEQKPVFAQAKFSFEGKNNDELSFTKNDLITITQQEDGGWWEGTIGGQTGWFPSNYVVIASDKDKLMRSRSVPNANIGANGVNATAALTDFVGSAAARNQFRLEVLKEFEKSEITYITSLRRTYEEYLLAIKKQALVPENDYNTLVCNLERILRVQADLLSEMQETLLLAPGQQRMGGVFIGGAALLKNLMLEYCENHPRAVEVLNEHESVLRQFMTSLGKDIRDLIMGLSEPFRHMDKYPVVLQELERNLADGHFDRGDVQRSCAVYKDIRLLCESVRKQKEMQLELLYTGQVEKWASFDERGKILYVGSGTVTVNNDEDSIDRCCVVFSKLMLILEITPEMNSYKLFKKLSTIGLVIKRSETKSDVVFTWPDYTFTIGLSSSFDADRWIEGVSRADGVKVEETSVAGGGLSRPASRPTSRPTTPLRSYVVNTEKSLPTMRTPDVEHSLPPIQSRINKKPSIGPGDFKLNHDLEMIVPDGIEENPMNRSMNGRKPYVGLLLHHYPPHRGAVFSADVNRKNVKMRKEVAYDEAEDTALLRIVEGYCSGAAKVALAGVELKGPQLIVAEDEKILMEEIIGDEVVIQEKSLVDTVYALKDQLYNMRQEMQSLKSSMEREQKARRRLEETIRRHSGLSGIASPQPPAIVVPTVSTN